MEEILLKNKDHAKHSGDWWKIRHKYIRTAIVERRYKKAYALLQNSRPSSAYDKSNAAWLKGWLNLEFLGRPRQSQKYFEEFLSIVSFPVSVARGNYWLAKTHQRLGASELANTNLQKASKFANTFYGQLAIMELYNKVKIKFPKPDYYSASDARSDLTETIKRLIDYDKEDFAYKLLKHFIAHNDDVKKRKYAAYLAGKFENKKYKVRTGKQLMRYGIYNTDLAYPVLKKGDEFAIEKPFNHAIARQESEFDELAVSRANAYGLMQILKGTAREVARKNKITYSSKKLFDSHYNMTLGSLYLNSLVNGFDGSYIQAIASYNAGPSRVRRWREQYGTPHENLRRTINWIEKIPFSETRNYVQRVMKNLHVYRSILDEDATLNIVEDLQR